MQDIVRPVLVQSDIGQKDQFMEKLMGAFVATEPNRLALQNRVSSDFPLKLAHPVARLFGATL